jgi:hypothetical protein
MSAADKQPGLQSEVEPSDMQAPGVVFNPCEASSYIVSLIVELRSIAIAANFRFLAYLLEMTFQEAYRLESELGREGKAQGTGERR